MLCSQPPVQPGNRSAAHSLPTPGGGGGVCVCVGGGGSRLVYTPISVYTPVFSIHQSSFLKTKCPSALWCRYTNCPRPQQCSTRNLLVSREFAPPPCLHRHFVHAEYAFGYLTGLHICFPFTVTYFGAFDPYFAFCVLFISPTLLFISLLRDS